MKAERFGKPPFVPILLTLETEQEALVLKAISCADQLVADAVHDIAGVKTRYPKKEEIALVLNRLWGVLGSLGVDAAMGTA